MPNRSEAIENIKRARIILDQESEERARCVRLVSAAFLGVVLEPTRMQLKFIISENRAGLKTIGYPDELTAHSLRTIKRSSPEINGVIIETEILNDNTGHRTGVLFGDKKDQSVLYIDALVSPQRFAIYNTSEEAFTYMSSHYNLSQTWVHIVLK